MADAEAHTKAYPQRAARIRARMSAKLILPGGKSSAECIVHNINEGGAFVKLSKPTHLPPKLELMIIKTRMIYSVEVGWNRNSFAGLRFTSTGRLARI
jgi:hypothetical protein